MIILGIHDGHNCGASLFQNGTLLIAISEEKITRNKNEYGYPEKSIKGLHIVDTQTIDRRKSR